MIHLRKKRGKSKALSRSLINKIANGTHNLQWKTLIHYLKLGSIITYGLYGTSYNTSIRLAEDSIVKDSFSKNTVSWLC